MRYNEEQEAKEATTIPPRVTIVGILADPQNSCRYPHNWWFLFSLCDFMIPIKSSVLEEFFGSSV
jgi:hypothetical protein